MPQRRFIVELTRAADEDFDNIYEWTLRTFGNAQAKRYSATLLAAINALTESAIPAGARERIDLGAGIYTLHIARRGRRGRHWLVYQLTDGQVLVLRILHDSMDIERHLPSNDES